MPSFAVACPSLCNWRIWHQMALIHIISLSRKFNRTTELFSQLFPLGHWGEATSFWIHPQLLQPYSTQTSETETQQMYAADCHTKSAYQIFWDFFFNNLKENALWNFASSFKISVQVQNLLEDNVQKENVQWVSRLKCYFPLFPTLNI